MKIIFPLFWSREGGGLFKFDIVVCKAAIATYIWSFLENLENYKKVILWLKDCILIVDMSNRSECF